jgi:SNF2 family DNA or RNA helicase
MDLFMQLEFLGEGYSGFSNYKAFRKFYGKFQTNEYTKRDKLVSYQNIPFIQERLARLSFMITKKEALPFLPEKVHDITEITMTAEQLEVYEQLQAQLAVEIKDKLDHSDNDLITVNNVLTMLLRLAQITSGYMALDGKVDPETGTTLKEAGKVRFFATNPKLDQLVEDLRAESETTKTIVWTVFVPTIRQISERLTREGIKHVVYFGGTSDEDREAAEVAFNNDDSVRVFIGNPAAGGCGLNLWGYNPADLVASCGLEQDDAEEWCESVHGCSYLEFFGEPYAKPQPRSAMNCDHVIRYSSNWSMVQRVQSEDRCHRIGTRKVVRYTDYIVPNSIDEEILNRVQGYKLTAETIQDVRDIMERVLGAVINEDAGSVDLLDLAEQEDADLDTEEAA